jgi:putative MATE family efflux protein
MNMLQLLFNAVNMVVAGRFVGSIALAAVGATGSLISLIVNFFMGLSVGTSVIVAQDYGANKLGDVSRTVHTSIYVGLISGLFVMSLGLTFCQPLLAMMGTPEDIIHLSALYMRIYFLGVPAIMLYDIGASILRAVGDSRHPMYFLVISGVVNVILNLFFVIALHMGVAGTALGTVLSQYLAVSFIIVFLIKSDGESVLFSNGCA